MTSPQQITAENEFFSLENINVSKSAILPNYDFDSHELADENGIEKPFTNSDNSIEREVNYVSECPSPRPQPREQCQYCQRQFFIGRLELHQKSCTKEHPLKHKDKHNDKHKDKDRDKNKNKLFFHLNKMEEKNSPTRNQSSIPRLKAEQQQLIQSIQFSRELERAEKNGDNIKELLEKAPKKPLESNYVFCQFCQRKFAPCIKINYDYSQDVAERHIPRCQNIFNRPQPPKSLPVEPKVLDYQILIILLIPRRKEPKALEKYSQFVGSSIHEEVEEIEVIDTLKNESQIHSKTVKTQQWEQVVETRMSQSQQQTGSGQSVFLPRLQKSPDHQIPLLSRSMPLVQCLHCLRTFDVKASQRHIPICQKIMKANGNQSIKQHSVEKQNKIIADEHRQFCTNCGSKFAIIHKYCGICGKKRQ